MAWNTQKSFNIHSNKTFQGVVLPIERPKNRARLIVVARVTFKNILQLLIIWSRRRGCVERCVVIYEGDLNTDSYRMYI